MNQTNTGPALVNASWGPMFEDLVPLSTQLVTPALAEAFDIPTAKASVPDSQLVHLANPGSGQTKSSYQVELITSIDRQSNARCFRSEFESNRCVFDSLSGFLLTCTAKKLDICSLP
jgi:hypothetical protein